MKKQKELSILTNFLKNLEVNEEASRTEVEIFLQTYLEYIFKLNNVDISRYDISIQQVQIDEYHTKQEKKYKKEPNQEDRKLAKRKALSKHPFMANCGFHDFGAIMRPDKHVDNKYTILLNKKLCRVRNCDEINSLFNLFYDFGHEVHHIIQYIKHKQDMYDYDYSIDVHDAYYNIYSNNQHLSPREVKKIKRAINQHLDKVYSCCSTEKYADKKGYDYLDILFNEILNNIHSDVKFSSFIEAAQEFNDTIYKDRLREIKLDEKGIPEINKRLLDLIGDEELTTIY